MDCQAGTVLRVEGLRKTYSSEATPLLTDLSFAIAPGINAALVGPNGSGKTTLLRILAGLVPYQAGAIHVGGERMEPRKGRARRFLGYVSDEETIPLRLSVGEYLDLMEGLSGRASGRVDASPGMDFDVDAYERMFLEQLSHGMTRRVQIVAAMTGEPPLLLLDEPDAGLDRGALELLATRLRERARRGGACLVATHRREWANTFCSAELRLPSGTWHSLEERP